MIAATLAPMTVVAEPATLPTSRFTEERGDELEPWRLQRAADFGRAQRRRAVAATADRRFVTGPRPGALSGKRIALSPGHGYVYRDGAWEYQRGITHSLREDTHNGQWAIDFVIEMMERAGAEVLNVRERSYGEISILIDNDDDGGYEESGEWQTSETPGFNGRTYRFAYCDGVGAAEAIWHVDVPEDGIYPVYVYFLTSNNRSDAARYRIEHAGGVTETTLAQDALRIESWSGGEPPSDTTAGSTELWHYLGTFPFRAGEAGRVLLSNQCEGAETVVIADALRVGAGMGEVDHGGGVSGVPRWRESALVYLDWLGAPDWVLTNDVTTRSMYAIYQGVDAYFAIHTNCCESSGTSLWTWYPEMWVSQSAWPSGFEEENLPPGTVEWAQSIRREVISAIQTNWQEDWPDAGLFGADFGELRPIRNAWWNDRNVHGVESPLAIPAALIEVAFHDTYHDAWLIRQNGFRRDVARGIVNGMIRYFAEDPEAMVPPIAPQAVVAVGIREGVEIRWAPGSDTVQENAAPARYHVYTSTDGVIFSDDPVITEETTALLEVDMCDRIYARVTAVNEAGESLDSPVVGARRSPDDVRRVLFVNGIDREEKTVDDPNNYREYAHIYCPALESMSGLGAIFVDTATDDAVSTSLVTIDDYLVAFWALGETGTAQGSLNPEDMNVVSAYLEGGGALLVSGAEYGWELVERGDDDDRAFVETWLRARYEADDAESTIVEPEAESGLAELGQIEFGSCSSDTVCIDWPDVLEPVDTAEAAILLRYAESGQTAAFRAPSGLGEVIVAGFPLETVVDSVQRRELIRLLALELYPDAQALEEPDCRDPIEPDGDADGDADSDGDGDGDADGDADGDGDGDGDGSGAGGGGCDCHIGGRMGPSIGASVVTAIAAPLIEAARLSIALPSALMGCGGSLHQVRPGRTLRGRATYYSDRLAGRSTASGEPYRPRRLTAAHRSLPFGTLVRVTNLNNDRTVEVRINDRGPFGNRDRIIDLSRRAAEELEMIRAGVVPVTVEILEVPGED